MRLHFFGRVTELGYVLALDARFCGFEPHPAYHFLQTKDSMKTSKTLYKAAQIILNKGWARGHTHYHGRVDMNGAIGFAAYGDPKAPPNREVTRALDKVLGGEKLHKFNDKHCKTHRDAVGLLQLAADIAVANGK